MKLSGLLCLVLLFGTSQAAWNVTCDFDLENIKEIVQYLPDECQRIYKEGPESELYKSSLSESAKFQEFYDGLIAYERKISSTPSGEVPKQDTELRSQIYNSAMLSECSEKITNNTELGSDEEKVKEFYGCLLGKREGMIQLIPT